jgi:hypothetical protein
MLFPLITSLRTRLRAALQPLPRVEPPRKRPSSPSVPPINVDADLQSQPPATSVMADTGGPPPKQPKPRGRPPASIAAPQASALPRYLPAKRHLGPTPPLQQDDGRGHRYAQAVKAAVAIARSQAPTVPPWVFFFECTPGTLQLRCFGILPVGLGNKQQQSEWGRQKAAQVTS